MIEYRLLKPPHKIKSITELEYRQAGTSDLPRLVFLADKEAPWPDEFRGSSTDEGEGGRRIADFRAELERATLVRLFPKAQAPDTTDRLVEPDASAAVRRAPETLHFAPQGAIYRAPTAYVGP